MGLVGNHSGLHLQICLYQIGPIGHSRSHDPDKSAWEGQPKSVQRWDVNKIGTNTAAYLRFCLLVTVLIKTYSDLLLRASNGGKEGRKDDLGAACHIGYASPPKPSSSSRKNSLYKILKYSCLHYQSQNMKTLPEICSFTHFLLCASASFLNPRWNKLVTIKGTLPAVAPPSQNPNTTCSVNLIKNESVILTGSLPFSTHPKSLSLSSFPLPRNYRGYLQPEVP